MAKKSAPYIVGNWKMYKTIDEALEFVDSVGASVEKASCHVWLSVPFTAIHSMKQKAENYGIVIGAQNMNDASEGAFTGEISGTMLKNAGAEFVLIGHSERRTIFGESNSFINKKIKRALASGLRPIVCIGESFDEHQAGKTLDVLEEQLVECFSEIEPNEIETVVIAYEPIWAIGTGLSADPELVGKTHAKIYEILEQKLKVKDAKKIPLLYGGSVSGSNAENYLQTSGISGLLIGSSSLKPEVFAKIVEIAQNIT